uniref:Lupanine 17-hydroxylase [cytochrome c] n=1 Tax=Pseudomonas sp. TaxID=306 RepID=LUH_PSESP|nr:RecName: Full=Lupanine 17-hydroxylase [cytochrome c]; AltName: Full=Quinohemoprotein lupanine hydroxylase; Flags: Precursor [Pseudomonas sp.]CAC67410.1 lupanine hydroxylase [Pseudomonas sp. DH2001]
MSANKNIWIIRLGVAFVCVAIGAAQANEKDGSAVTSGNWSLLGGGNEQHYFSALKDVNKSNVKNLGLSWFTDMEAGDGLVGNPLVADGVIYQGGPPGKIYANDLKTGKNLWTYTPEVQYDKDTSWTGFWGTHVNRGLAVDDDNVYIGSYCKLLAVSRTTHKLTWSSQSCDPKKMQAITGAPRVGGGKVFIGNASGDFGGDRGHLDAFDAKTGKHLWRFYTMPGDPSKPFENDLLAKASKTWGTDYWKYTKGGVSPWDAITYDEASDTLYFGTDGPSPWSPAQRAPDAGDELFSHSIIAVDASTGAYKWHFQTVQNDGSNMSATMHIMLADLPVEGVSKRVVMTAPKNGYFYVLDASTGKFISADHYVPVNWTKGLDPKTGRPIPSNEANYWERPGEMTIPLPGDVGGHNWEAMAYNPELRTVYIPSTLVPVTVVASKDTGELDLDYYYGMRPDATIKTQGDLVAWDPLLQKEKWRAKRSLPVNGGVLATAGGLVFQGTGDGHFEAFDANTGEKLWSFHVGGSILAAPTTVEVDGDQYLIVASGNGGASGMRGIPRLMNNLQSQGPARLLAFRLGGKTELPITSTPDFPKPQYPKPTSAMAESGRHIFNANACGACHGFNAEGSTPGLPDLRRSDKLDLAVMKSIVIDGAFKPLGMPGHPHISDADLQALQAFILQKAWTAYDTQQTLKTSDTGAQ